MKKTKNIVAAGALSLALLGGTVALALTAFEGTASAQTTAQQMVTQDTGGGHGLFARLRAHRQQVRQQTGQVTADAIGISVDDLKSELKSGKSIAQVATEHGVDPQTVSTAIDNDVNARLDQAVANKKLSQDRADKIKQKAPDVIDKVINHVFGQ